MLVRFTAIGKRQRRTSPKQNNILGGGAIPPPFYISIKSKVLKNSIKTY